MCPAFEPIDGVGINITDYNPTAKRHVLPLYYGYLAVADAIGTSGKSVSFWCWSNFVGFC